MIPKIWKALADDSLRIIMNHCFITPTDTVASDAHILVKHRTIDLFPETFVKTIPEHGFLLDIFAMKELAKTTATTVEFTEDKDYLRIQHINKNLYWIVEVPVKYQLDSHGINSIGTYPSYNGVIPDLKKDLGPQEYMTFKPQLLLNLAEAMGMSRSVKMKFNKSIAGAAFVKSDNEEYQSIGIIMPTMWGHD